MNRLPIVCLALLTAFPCLTSCGGADSEASSTPAPNKVSPEPEEANTPTPPLAKSPSEPEPKREASAASQSEEPDPKLEHSAVVALFRPEPIVKKVRNRTKKDKVALGKKLYHEKALSRNGDISCASCHPLDNWGQDGKKTSPGTGGAAGSRNTPTTFNAYRQFAQFWDFRAETVEQQATMPILTANEHGLKDEAEIESILSAIPDYVAEFKKVFPKDEKITAKNVAYAIAAFERKLETSSRFDAYIDGDEAALTNLEKKGVKVFMEVGCTTCHVTRLVGGQMKQKLGLIMPVPSEDKGRFEVTKEAGDTNFFKVPQLLNVAETGPYMHDGSIDSLAEVTRYMAKIQLARSLTEDQVKAIVAFLEALTGETPEIAK